MFREENTYQSLDDIVFEGRNKEYGAYQHRRSYPYHLKLAAGISLLLVLGSVMAYYIRLRLLDTKPPVKENMEWVFEDIEVPEAELLPPPPPPPPPPPAIEEQRITTVKDTEVEIVENNKADSIKSPDVSNDTAAIAKNTHIGDTTATNLGKSSVNDGPSGSGPEDNSIHYSVDGTEAYFPGGEDELNKYLSESLAGAQARAKKLGEQGVVYVSFVIEKDGSVSNVQLLKGLHICLTCNEEAIEVIKNMPSWTPAESKLGHKIRRSIRVPIRFQF